MVSSAQRDGEFIADLASECAVLCEPQVVGIRRSSAANQAILWLGPATLFQWARIVANTVGVVYEVPA